MQVVTRCLCLCTRVRKQVRNHTFIEVNCFHMVSSHSEAICRELFFLSLSNQEYVNLWGK